MSRAWFVAGLVGAALAGALQAQTYSVTEVNAMSGPQMTTTIYRNGSKAVIDQSSAPNAQSPKGFHVRTFYNLDSHTSFTWDLISTAGGCSTGNFSGDWGDPVAKADDLNGTKMTGTEMANGFSAKVYEADIQGTKVKLWVEEKSGITLREQMMTAGAATQTVVDVKQISLTAPPASVFALPASCAAAANTPHVPTDDERIAAETGGKAGDFANAILPPASGPGQTCAVVIRVVKAGSMQTIASGYQVAVDTTYDQNHPASYSMGVGANGRVSFSGGGLHEITSHARIESAPAYFYADASFGNGGEASALIYRQCSGPVSTLLYMVKNPGNLREGGDWIWDLTGKFAAGK